jgi:hypothetical protein
VYFFIKVVISAIIIAAASELAKQHRMLSVVLLSLPLTSLLAFIWIYIDLGDSEKIVHMSQDILWLVAISLIFFIIFPLLLRQGVNFWLALLASATVTTLGYGAVLWVREFVK